MHRLTNADADRLASTLDRAALICQQRAAESADVGQACAAIGSIGMATAWSSHAETARLSAEDLRDLARRLRTREPLWDPPRAADV